MTPYVAIGLDRQWPSIAAHDRAMAAMALGKTGNPRAIEPLIGALMDTTVRNEVIEVLGILGDVRAVEPLIAVLQTQGVERSVTMFRTIEVLVGLGDLRAVDPLIILTLQDQDIYVRFAAVKALSRLIDARAVRPLITIAGNTDQVYFAGNTVSLSVIAIKGLQKVLEFCAPSIDPEDLRLIAALEGMLKYRQVRQLACQELIRRGLQA
jgi:HEAT repeat protein